MRFALEVWSKSWREIERTAERAEQLGYHAFYYGESPTDLNLDCWSVLAALARTTRTIRIGPVIANLLPSHRSLALLAKQSATVALLSEGRLDFRSGAGASRRHAAPWWRPFGVAYPDYETRLARVDRWLPMLRALWRGAEVALDRDRDSPPASLGFAVPPIPVTLAATSDRGIACAARHADVWEASYRSAREFRELSRRFDGLRASTARPAARALEVDVFVADTPDALRALMARVRAERGPEDAEGVIDRSLHGTPDAIRAQLTRLREAGVEQLLLAFHDPHDARALAAFARAMESFGDTRSD